MLVEKLRQIKDDAVDDIAFAFVYLRLVHDDIEKWFGVTEASAALAASVDEETLQLLDASDVLVRKLALDLASKLRTHYFHSRAGNMTYVPNFDPTDTVQTIEMRMKVAAGAKKYKLPVYAASGIDDGDRDRILINTYDPIHLDPLARESADVIQMEKDAYREYLNNAKALNEGRFDLWEVLGNYWAYIYAAWNLAADQLQMLDQRSPPTLTSFLSVFADFKTVAKSMFLDLDELATLPRIIQMPCSLPITTKEFTPPRHASYIHQLSHAQAWHLLQHIGMHYWTAPFHNPIFLDGLQALTECLCRYVVFAYSTDRLNSEGMIMPIVKYKRDLAGNLNNITDSYTTTPFHNKILFGMLCDLWRKIHQARLFQRRIWLDTVTSENGRARFQSNIADLASKVTVPESAEREFMLFIMQFYIPPGTVLQYQTERTTGSNNSIGISSHCWTQLIYNKIIAAHKRHLSVRVIDESMDGLLRFYTIIECLTLHMDTLFVPEFRREFIIHRTDKLHLCYSYPDDQDEPYFALVGNRIAICNRGTLAMSETNDPETLILYFFKIVHIQCGQRLRNIDLSDLLHEMGVTSKDTTTTDTLNNHHEKHRQEIYRQAKQIPRGLLGRLTTT